MEREISESWKWVGKRIAALVNSLLHFFSGSHTWLIFVLLKKSKQ